MRRLKAARNVGGRISLREALGTPESVRTATHGRSTLGSRVLTHPLNLTDALGRLTLSPLTRIGMPRIASLRETRPPTVSGTRSARHTDVPIRR